MLISLACRMSWMDTVLNLFLGSSYYSSCYLISGIELKME